MDIDAQRALINQMNASMNTSEDFINNQNHGPSTGNTLGEGDDELVNDLVLDKAIEIIRESPTFDALMKKYHQDVAKTQKMASDELRDQKKR